MTIQHSAITDPEVHEPKGASLALAGNVYVANGSGSGVWDKLNPNNLKSSTADFNTAGSKLVVNNMGGIGTEPGTSIGVMTFTGNSTATALGNNTFATVFGPSAPWASFVNKNAIINPASGEVTAPVTGIYKITALFVADGAGYNNNIKTRFMISSGVFSPFENIFSRLKNDSGTLMMEMVAPLDATDSVSVQIAGVGLAGTIVLISGALRIEYLGEQ